MNNVDKPYEIWNLKKKLRLLNRSKSNPDKLRSIGQVNLALTSQILKSASLGLNNFEIAEIVAKSRIRDFFSNPKILKNNSSIKKVSEQALSILMDYATIATQTTATMRLKVDEYVRNSKAKSYMEYALQPDEFDYIFNSKTAAELKKEKLMTFECAQNQALVEQQKLRLQELLDLSNTDIQLKIDTVNDMKDRVYKLRMLISRLRELNI
jgi:hypothetical protein